jgi:hypothetical protein
VNSYWHTQYNITERQRSQLNLSRNSHRQHDLWVPFDVYFHKCLLFATGYSQRFLVTMWIYIVAPCILITLKFLSPTNAPLY